MRKTSDLPTEYFKVASQALTRSGIFSPTLLIDRDRLDHNIDQFLTVKARGFNFRIVAKSLPSIPLLLYVIDRAKTNRLMSFHLPFLFHVVEHIPSADILMGKPMPAAGAAEFYTWFQQHQHSSFDPQEQLHWLIDTNERLTQYQQLATKLKTTVNVSLEIDVGLHRGGFSDQTELRQALATIKQDPYLKLTGLMGYEAHICRVPSFIGGPQKAFKQAMEQYQRCIDSVIELFGQQYLEGMILNAGGSSTYPLYDAPSIVNELATASALVMPTDFDVFTLEHHLPAAFIATPILKLVDKPQLPMASSLSTLLRALGVLPQKACFIYGGNWFATPCYPPKSKRANILGHSSNQEMFALDRASKVHVDDYFFLRPSQSESVFLQFGQIAILQQGKIIEQWPVFDAQPCRHEK